MGWLARKVDNLIGAVFAAVGGVGLSQFQAFVHQYLQRLGGHMDEAKRHFDLVREPGRYANLDVDSRNAIITEAWQRLEHIQQGYVAIKNGDFFTRPVAFVRHLDQEIALRTLSDFQPAVPIDRDSLIYAACGMILALLAWEFAKWPFAATFGALGRRSRGARAKTR